MTGAKIRSLGRAGGGGRVLAATPSVLRTFQPSRSAGSKPQGSSSASKNRWRAPDAGNQSGPSTARRAARSSSAMKDRGRPFRSGHPIDAGSRGWPPSRSTNGPGASSRTIAGLASGFKASITARVAAASSGGGSCRPDAKGWASATPGPPTTRAAAPARRARRSGEKWRVPRKVMTLNYGPGARKGREGGGIRGH